MQLRLGSERGTVTIYVQFTTSLQAGSPLDPFIGSASFDESNGNTGTTTNDSFHTNADAPVIGDVITDSHGGNQGGLCTGDLTQTGFTTNLAGQQANVADLTASAVGDLPCTPVAAGVRGPSPEENTACGKSGCPTPISFVFFPVLDGGAKATVTLIFPTIPSTITSWQKTPLFELLGTGAATTQVQVANCTAAHNPSPDTCITNLAKYGSQGVQFTVMVAGSPFDGRYIP